MMNTSIFAFDEIMTMYGMQLENENLEVVCKYDNEDNYSLINP